MLLINTMSASTQDANGRWRDFGKREMTVNNTTIFSVATETNGFKGQKRVAKGSEKVNNSMC
jgi:hypothetical protein